MENQQEAAVAEEKRKSESKDEDGEEEGEADNWEDNWDAASDGSDDTPAPPEFVIDQVKGYRQDKERYKQHKTGLVTTGLFSEATQSMSLIALEGRCVSSKPQGSETWVICLSFKSQINVSGLFCSLPKHSLPY